MSVATQVRCKYCKNLITIGAEGEYIYLSAQCKCGREVTIKTTVNYEKEG